MATMSTDRARELLGALNGHDVLVGGHANHNGMDLIAAARRPWFWPQRVGKDRQPRERGPEGSRLIAWALALLFALGLGLLTVSYAAQFRYVMAERHQEVASAIKAGCLDVGLCILSLLALGLARKGLSSSTERALIVVVAFASAAMNYAAADATSPRSVLAYVVPPLFLAVVVDRTVATIRRHVLGMQDGRSPWAATGRAGLYALRLVLAPVSTPRGLRQWVLDATPLPASPRRGPVAPAAAAPAPMPPAGRPASARAPRAHGDTKTARFLAVVRAKYGDFGAIAEDRVSPICSELAPTVGLDCGAARTALRARVLAALPAGEGDVR